MNKPLLSLGIILSLASVGCAGFGMQQSSSLGAQLRTEQGLDALWVAEEDSTAPGLEAPRYADQRVLELWDGTEAVPEGRLDPGYGQSRSGGDLWNPASVSRSWDRGGSFPGPRGRGLSDQLFSEFSSRRQARRTEIGVQ